MHSLNMKTLLVLCLWVCTVLAADPDGGSVCPSACEPTTTILDQELNVKPTLADLKRSVEQLNRYAKIVSSYMDSLSNELQECMFSLTVDPNTAFDKLLLSEKNKKVAHVDAPHGYPRHPERFTSFGQVMTKEALPADFYFECEWSGPAAGLAITYESISRGGFSSRLGYNDKSWSLECNDGGSCSVWHNHVETKLAVNMSGSRRLGAAVDRSAGTVSFYNACPGDRKLLHTFKTTFKDERLFAGFVLFEGTTVLLL
ncbi:stonustoxin subunit beta-like [Engraulis encrasicolus]|uniref:stonustoxin subunit beta-like n=1 Tax=Engraulis encrasicolus TaxID=184585 RepID=UPI002FD27D0B